MRRLAILIISLCLSHGLLSAQNKPEARPKPFVLGQIQEIKSVQLGENRVLNIYLPEGYKQSDTTRYPVIYLLDGSADEDFIHVAGLVQFANFPWVNILPKSILVGVANVDRKRDFTFPTTVKADKNKSPTSGSAAKFIAFIEKELQPFIEQQYKTTSSKTIIGESLGGLLATQILFEKPQLFNRYMIISPSLWWDNESLLATQPMLNTNATIFLAVGKEGDVMEGDARKLKTMLEEHKNFKVYFQYFPAEDHGTIMHLAVYAGFQSFTAK